MKDDTIALAEVHGHSSSWAAVDSVQPTVDEGGIEHNDVLQFLLGKTRTIQSRESLCISTTNPKGLDAAANVSEVAVKPLKAQVDESLSVTSKGLPELEPTSETDSEDDVFINYKTTSRQPSSHLDNDGTQQCAGRIQENNASMTNGLKQRADIEKPEVQPESEDVGTNSDDGGQLRQRRRGSKSNGNHVSKSSRTEKPTHLPPPQWSSCLDAFATHLATQRDELSVMFVLCVLLVYCAAITYRAMNPINYPLPNVDALFTPWDVSNMSARFRSPARGQSFAGAVVLEWEIANFPVEALHKHGPEPFEYRVFLDEQQLLFDVGVWSIEPDEDPAAAINKTFGYRLRPRDIPGLGLHTLRLEVTVGIPGSDDELLSLSDTTMFTFSPPDSTAPHLLISSPRNGATIRGHSFVVEYEAHNVHTLHAVVDRKWRMRKEHISDGNLLVRGLSAGAHSIRLEAFDVAGALVAHQEIRVEQLPHEPELKQ